MADEMVLRAQRFINLTYGSLAGIHVDEDGTTGWATMYALTRALQYELGITALSNNFGPTTLAALEARWPVLADQGVPANVVRIVQSGLYCKGYDGGNISGVYDERTDAGVGELKTNMSVAVAYPRGVTPKVFKALLTMDAYVVVSGGNAEVRTVQQWMNARYVNRRNYFIVPCDGHFSRDVQKALMLAIQYEIGMSDDVANGAFGPGTQAGLRSNTISEGSSGVWVQLFSAAMLFNRRAGVVFTSGFSVGLGSAVRLFQDFVKLPVTGKGDFQTWASLLVSTGDATRKGTALDCVTEITPARATALHAAGYRIVGRYLCNVEGTTLNKMIRAGELATIVANGLRAFPIYQTYGGEVGYFRPEQGRVDALDAIHWARYHGFKPGARIYFAVDYDALDSDVTSNIIKHFRAIKSVIDDNSGYQVGIYGPRNVCSRVAAAGLTSASFVCDMSTGFSGNLGYPLPTDWAFDQIATISAGSGDGRIDIDNDIASGRDEGHNSFAPEGTGQRPDVGFDPSYKAALFEEVWRYLESIGIPEENGGFTHVYTTTEAFDTLLSWDALLTSLSRAYQMRKALIQVPILWELRHLTKQDVLKDAAVRVHYETGLPGPPDSSTGPGQIFAATAIEARNYAVGQGLLNDTIRDPGSEADLWPIWDKLASDPEYNMGTVPIVHIWGASTVGAPRPSLDYNEENTLKVLIRYQGSGPDAEREGAKRLELYKIIERYNALVRGS